MNPALEAIRQLEEMKEVDRLSKPVLKLVRRYVKPTPIRNLLSGTYIGHPLHPLLTDLPIGAWTMATALDLIGGRSSRKAADILVGLGILSAVPTAASGLNDWSDTYGSETRLGFFHAAINTGALGLFVLSSFQRLRGHRVRGKLLGLAGLGTLVTGSYLGGHLSFVNGINVNKTAGLEGPRDWTPVAAEEELGERELKRVDAAGTPLVLYRDAGRIFALAATCSHMGGPLDKGSVSDGCVTCPWHGSIFRLSDGSIVRGPASTPQPAFEARLSSGKIEVRAAG